MKEASIALSTISNAMKTAVPTPKATVSKNANEALANFIVPKLDEINDLTIRLMVEQDIILKLFGSPVSRLFVNLLKLSDIFFHFGVGNMLMLSIPPYQHLS